VRSDWLKINSFAHCDWLLILLGGNMIVYILYYSKALSSKITNKNICIFFPEEAKYRRSRVSSIKFIGLDNKSIKDKNRQSMSGNTNPKQRQ
jgi:hypothetical protein